MNGMKSICVLIFSVFVAVSFSQYASAETSNKVIALVNDEVITLHELNNKIEEMTGLTPNQIRSKDEKSYIETRGKIIELLINEKLTQEKVMEMGIEVTSNQIDNTIENIKTNNKITHEELIADLMNKGMTYEKFQDIIKKDLERMMLINYEVKSKIIIRESQLLEYYENHKEQYTIEGRVHLAGIFLNNHQNDAKGLRDLSKKGEDILARLRNKKDFGELAKDISEGPGANEGGDLGIFKTAQLDPVLRKALKTCPWAGSVNLL